MDLYISHLFSSASTWMLSALVAGGLFFAMVGVRELNVRHSDGLLYIMIGAFFFLIALIFVYRSFYGMRIEGSVAGKS